MEQKIYGLYDHPNKSVLQTYGIDAPHGEWRAELDALAWGKSQNLFCYFTAVASGDTHRLSVFSRHDYQPYNGEVSFRLEKTGSVYIVTTEPSKRSKFPKFMKAVLA